MQRANLTLRPGSARARASRSMIVQIQASFQPCRIGELTGKGRQVGHNVSHANNKTKRLFLPNLQNVTLMSESLIAASSSASRPMARSVEHNGGLDNWLLKAADAKLSPRAQGEARAVKAVAARSTCWRHHAACAERAKPAGFRPDWQLEQKRCRCPDHCCCPRPARRSAIGLARHGHAFIVVA